MSVKDRLRAVIALADARSLDAILVWNLLNVRYLSGFTGTEGALLITRDQCYFLTDFRYETQGRQEAPDFQVRISLDKIDNIVAAIRQSAAKKIGYEDETLSVGRFKALKSALGRTVENARLTPLGLGLDALRLHKDEDELELLRRSARMAEEGFARALKTLRPGMKEKEVVTELELGMRLAGASRPSFETIVASGPRGALPHGLASDKVIRNGEMVVIDFGCVYRGYCSDQTITVAVGKIGDEERTVYEIVREAQEIALSKLRPGVPLREVDQAARDHITKAGYGDYFRHGLGHGLGLDIHEAPRLSTRSESLAEPGMVFTIEPGIYLPERFGVRIEDTVVVNATGYERITNLDKSLIESS